MPPLSDGLPPAACAVIVGVDNGALLSNFCIAAARATQPFRLSFHTCKGGCVIFHFSAQNLLLHIDSHTSARWPHAPDRECPGR